MVPSCLLETPRAAGGVLVWRTYSWHSLDPLVLTKHRLNAAAYLKMVADHVRPFMTTVDWCHLQLDNAPFHQAQIMSWWFLEYDTEFCILNWIERLWDVVEREICIIGVQLTELQWPQSWPHDAIMLIWTNISDECLQHLVENLPRRIKAALKAKGLPPPPSYY